MESLGDILKRLQQQISSGAADYPAEWLAAEAEEDAEPGCPVCGGRGWVRRDVPLKHPDFGRAFPCTCQRELSMLSLLGFEATVADSDDVKASIAVPTVAPGDGLEKFSPTGRTWA